MPHGSGRRSWERHCTIRVVPDSAALAAFLLRAKRATYAAQGDDATVTPLIPGSKQLEYREGERLYRDVYVGLTTFAGLETVDDTGAPRWAMTYAGGLVAPADFPAVYAFLREALQRGDVAAPYRGPARRRRRLPAALRRRPRALSGSLVGRDAGRLADDAHDHARREAAAQQMVAQAGCHAIGPAPAQRGQPAPRGLAGTRQRVVAAERDERGGDHGHGDAAGAQLHPEACGAIAARGAGRDPVAGERRVVHVAARDEIVHDLGGHVGGSAATAQPRGEIRARPRAAGEQVARREAGGLGVENPARRYDFSGAGALSPSVSRILASRSASTLAFS